MNYGQLPSPGPRRRPRTGPSMRGGKLGNDYADLIPHALYADTPKAVLAAIVVSRLVNIEGKETPDEIAEAIRDEWAILHANGIVPQKPTKANGGAA